MPNDKPEPIVELNYLIAQAAKLEYRVPPRVITKLRQNAELIPSKWDFNSSHEEKYRLELNDIPAFPEAVELIHRMRIIRQRISNLDFKVEQDSWPDNTMKV